MNDIFKHTMTPAGAIVLIDGGGKTTQFSFGRDEGLGGGGLMPLSAGCP